MHDDELRSRLVREAKRLEEDTLYSAKGNFVAATWWSKSHWWLGMPAAVLAAAAGAAAFDNRPGVAGIISLIVAMLTAASTFLNPNQHAHAHLVAGKRFNALRNRTRIFHEIEVGLNKAANPLVEQLKAFQVERSEIEQESPQIPQWAYRWAKRGIEEVGEATYQVDITGE